MSIVFTNLGLTANPDFSSGTDGQSFSNTSWTPPTSGLIIATVYSRRVGGGDPSVPTVNGNGITWVQIATVLTAGNHRLTLYGANAAGSTAGWDTVFWDPDSQDMMHCQFMHAAGVNLSGGVAAAFVQAPTGSGQGTSGSITYAAAGNAANRPFAAFGLSSTPGMFARTNWTPADDEAVFSAENQTQYRTDAFDTAASATWDGVSRAWVGIAVELKALLFVPVEQVIETDIANAITIHKQRSIGQVNEVDNANAITMVKRRLVGQVSEADVANDVTVFRVSRPEMVSHPARSFRSPNPWRLS